MSEVNAVFEADQKEKGEKRERERAREEKKNPSLLHHDGKNRNCTCFPSQPLDISSCVNKTCFMCTLYRYMMTDDEDALNAK